MAGQAIHLTDHEFAILNGKYPPGKASGQIGQRAEEIVQISFRRVDPKCVFERPRNGADLQVKFANGDSLLLEIKGTAALDISWNKLKISSSKSHSLLVDQKIPIYRVTAVFEQTPYVFIIKHGEDFKTEPEPRWSIRPIRAPLAQPKCDTPSPRETSVPKSKKGKSKYDGLESFLRNQKSNEVVFKFRDAMQKLGFRLPASALNYQAYWANQLDTKSRPWARAWQDAGFHVSSIHLNGEQGWVVFKRTTK